MNAIIWILAAVVLFVLYCKKVGKTPGEVLGGTNGSSEPAATNTPAEVKVPAKPAAAKTEEEPDTEPEDETYAAMYMITGSNKITYVNYANVVYVRNAVGQTAFHLSLNKAQVLKCTALVERLAADMANQPEDFDLNLFNQFDALSAEALKFCWIYFHLKGYTFEDINGEEYLCESISEIETNDLQKQRKNWSRWATLIRKNRQTLDALIGFELE